MLNAICYPIHIHKLNTQYTIPTYTQTQKRGGVFGLNCRSGDVPHGPVRLCFFSGGANNTSALILKKKCIFYIVNIDLYSALVTNELVKNWSQGYFW